MHLEEVAWVGWVHAYGPAGDVPGLLRTSPALGRKPGAVETRDLRAGAVQRAVAAEKILMCPFGDAPGGMRMGVAAARRRR
jgi:hypothetical protein